MESFDSLWEYCTANKRLIPKECQKLYNLLKNKRQQPSGGWLPPLPLILAAWDVTMPIEKQMRFKEHIQWALDNEQIDEIGTYLRELTEDEWYHFGEL